jgi:hypothetical protein
MAKKRNIGATLSLKEGNFFVNIKKATSELGCMLFGHGPLCCGSRRNGAIFVGRPLQADGPL